MITHSMVRARRCLVPLLLTTLAAGCSDSGTAGPAYDVTGESPALARGGERGKPGGGGDGGGSGSTEQLPPIVESATPSSAPRDTTLDVEISGDNFVDGSTVAFELDGDASAGITTNATRYVNSKRLVSNITIAADAAEAFYDVRVKTPPGRKGVGLESVGIDLFEVAPSTVTTFSDRTGDKILSDGRTYADGECGVLSDFNLGDARLDPDATYSGKMKKTCPDGSRTLTFVWDTPTDGGDSKPARTDGIFLNIDAVETETGTGVLHHGQFNVCGRLLFNPDDAFSPDNGSDRLLVSYDDAGSPENPFDDSWTVETRPYPNDKGFCEGDGRLWHMPFEFVVRRR